MYERAEHNLRKQAIAAMREAAAASKPPITGPTKPSKASSNFSPQLDGATRQSRTCFVYHSSGKN
jgi:hypothetical protein